MFKYYLLSLSVKNICQNFVWFLINHFLKVASCVFSHMYSHLNSVFVVIMLGLVQTYIHTKFSPMQMHRTTRENTIQTLNTMAYRDIANGNKALSYQMRAFRCLSECHFPLKTLSPVLVWIHYHAFIHLKRVASWPVPIRPLVVRGIPYAKFNI